MTEPDPRTHAIIGVAMEVHREMGCGLNEVFYQEALAMEFTQRGIPHVREPDLPSVLQGKSAVLLSASRLCLF
jgi:GxxExxY protein